MSWKTFSVTIYIDLSDLSFVLLNGDKKRKFSKPSLIHSRYYFTCPLSTSHINISFSILFSVWLMLHVQSCYVYLWRTILPLDMKRMKKKCSFVFCCLRQSEVIFTSFAPSNQLLVFMRRTFTIDFWFMRWRIFLYYLFGIFNFLSKLSH